MGGGGTTHGPFKSKPSAQRFAEDQRVMYKSMKYEGEILSYLVRVIRIKGKYYVDEFYDD